MDGTDGKKTDAMAQADLEALAADIVAIRKAIKVNNPLLREAAAPKGFAALSAISAIIIAAYCGLAQWLVAVYGSPGNLPSAWKIALIVSMAVIVAAGTVAKIVVLGRGASPWIGGAGGTGGGKKEGKAGLSRVLGAFYGGQVMHIAIPVLVCVGVACAFAVWAGHPWYSVCAVLVFFGIYANMISIATGLREYLFTGYVSIGFGLASLFFIERLPFAVTGAILFAMLMAFAVVNAVMGSREKSGR